MAITVSLSGFSLTFCVNMLDLTIMKLFSSVVAFMLAIGSIGAQEAAVQSVAPPTSLAQAIDNTPFITEHKPDSQAQYYMYFFTASWCAPCRAVTPKIVAEYASMISNHYMEVILVSFDDTEEQARAYLRKYEAPFAAILFSSLPSHPLPGCPPDVNAIPHIIVVDSHGNFIYRGHALRYSEWKSRTTPSEK